MKRDYYEITGQVWNPQKAQYFPETLATYESYNNARAAFGSWKVTSDCLHLLLTHVTYEEDEGWRYEDLELRDLLVDGVDHQILWLKQEADNG